MTAPGATVGPRSPSIYRGATPASASPAASIGVDGYVSFKVPITKAKLNGVYKVFLKIGDVNGNSLTRTATVTVR